MLYTFCVPVTVSHPLCVESVGDVYNFICERNLLQCVCYNFLFLGYTASTPMVMDELF